MIVGAGIIHSLRYYIFKTGAHGFFLFFLCMPFAVVPPCFLLPRLFVLALPQGGAPLQTTHTIGTQCDPSPSCVFTTIEYSLYAARSFFEPGILLLHVFLKNFKKSAGAFAFSDVLVLPISPQNMLRGVSLHKNVSSAEAVPLPTTPCACARW